MAAVQWNRIGKYIKDFSLHFRRNRRKRTEDEDDEHLIDHLMEVYTSWIDDAISNYNSDFYYQSRDYLFACYQEGEICP